MKSFWIICILIPIGVLGYHVNTQNYLKHKEIQQNVINHPEKLPNSDMARISAFGFTNIMADMYWLQSVQYIGENVIGGEYKKYLGTLMGLITDLNPFFESPYVIGQLLLPSNETDTDEDFTEAEMRENIIAGRDLGLKGVKNFCDDKKIEAISEENDLGKIIYDETGIYKNPCQSYKIPFYLGYIYYYYLGDGSNAAKYYKIVSAQKDAPEGARVLAAIMQGKGGEREKSLFMFLSLAKSVGGETESCTVLSAELERVYTEINTLGLTVNSKLIYDIEQLSKQVLPVLTQENESEVLDDTKCSNYLAKAIREINLLYIENAHEKFMADNENNSPAKHAKELLDTGYIDFLPTDYQQYPEESYGVIYEYNEDIGRFDYDMGTYR